MTSTTIYLEPSAAKRRVQIINDALPGALLLFTGLGTLIDRGFTQTIMPYISIFVGAVVIRSAIGEIRYRPLSSKINLFDISAGFVIIIEASNMYKSYKGFQPAHLLGLAGLITIVKGIVAEGFPRLRRVELGEQKLFARTSLVHSLSLLWADIQRIDRSASALHFVLGDRKTVLSLRRAGNRTEIMGHIIEAARRQGIRIEEGK